MPYFQYLDQFLIIAVAHILAVVSPGPDFFLVVRQSFLYGRKKTILTSLGIASGILIHTSYCSLGLSFILSHEFIYNALKILCAIYLFYLGFKSVLSKPDKNIFDNQNIKDNNFKTDILSSAILDFNGIYSSFTCSTQANLSQQVLILGTKKTINLETPFNANAKKSTLLPNISLLFLIWIYLNIVEMKMHNQNLNLI